MSGSFDPRTFVRNLTTRPGVYRMLDGAGKVLYVGKASNLKNRVGSYFRGKAANAKTMALVNQTADVEVTVTDSEADALLLEYNLIKRHRPRYNITLRDDKSFPYIRASLEHDFPRLSFYRGPRNDRDRYFGPYPSAGAVRETLSQLQKLFQLRQCNDTFFANRSRPCLQYQIRRCSAPCVGLVGKEQYARDVEHALMYLDGESQRVIEHLATRMERAAELQEFERAAHYRDQIASLKRVQARSLMAGGRVANLDVLAAVTEQGVHAVGVLSLRRGRNLGTRTYFPRATEHDTPADVLSAFAAQYYLGREAPPEIVTSAPVEDHELLAATLGRRLGHNVRFRHRVRADRARWLSMTADNARHAARLKLASGAGLQRQFESLRSALKLAEPPRRIECFDISHTGGEAAVGACVVFTESGPAKSEYRRFNIRDIDSGDDYAAMRQALERRYLRLKRGEAALPDVLLIDGGKGQIAQAEAVLEELQIDGVTVVGVAKGADRRVGEERLFQPGSTRPLKLGEDSPGLQLIQRVRDEAHRFAITGHRQRRERARRTSVLESIPGLGPKRRRELLRQFGGLQGIERAGLEELGKVKGISQRLARVIYDNLHAR